MTPTWLNDTVSAFGRQMGLKALALGARDAAGVRFENGYELRFEYTDGALAMMVTVPSTDDPETVRLILQAAHPAARRGLTVRSGLFGKSGRAFFHARLAERDVSVDVLERVFRELWAVAGTVGRRVA